MTRYHPVKSNSVSLSRWMGGATGTVAYLILSVAQPLDWRLPVWAVLAFVTVPTLVAYVCSKLLGPQTESPVRFKSAFCSGAVAMFLYTSISLMIVHSRIGPISDDGHDLRIGLFVSVVYAAIAGVVAGAGAAYFFGAKGQRA